MTTNNKKVPQEAATSGRGTQVKNQDYLTPEPLGCQDLWRSEDKPFKKLEKY